jgi:hypothetical protein
MDHARVRPPVRAVPLFSCARPTTELDVGTATTADAASAADNNRSDGEQQPALIVRAFGGATGNSLQGVARTGFDVAVAVDKPLGVNNPGFRIEVGRRDWAVPEFVIGSSQIKPADRYLQDRLVIAAMVLSPPAPPGRSFTHERISGTAAGGLGLTPHSQPKSCFLDPGRQMVPPLEPGVVQNWPGYLLLGNFLTALSISL